MKEKAYAAYYKKKRGYLRRRRQVRRNISIAVIAAVILLSTVLAASISSQANDLEHGGEYKCYKSIEIAKGDTLWSIAKENIDTDHYDSVAEYVSEIKAMNSIKSDLIISGSYIIIPYYSKASANQASDF